jgi:chromosome segregation ATPase
MAGMLAGAASQLAMAQAPDRERAQLMQMQQQLQRLQQDNAALQTSARQDGEKLKKQTQAAESAQREATQLRAKEKAQARESDDLRGQLAATQEALTAAKAESEQLRKELAQRDEALNQGAERERRGEQAQALLTERLKEQTGRADHCETQHAGAMTFAGSVIDRYEQDRLRLCEPVTGIWKPRAENRIQDLRDRLSSYRLDAPTEAPR